MANKFSFSRFFPFGPKDKRKNHKKTDYKVKKGDIERLVASSPKKPKEVTRKDMKSDTVLETKLYRVIMEPQTYVDKDEFVAYDTTVTATGFIDAKRQAELEMLNKSGYFTHKATKAEVVS